MLYSCTHMATVGVKGLTQVLRWTLCSVVLVKLASAPLIPLNRFFARYKFFTYLLTLLVDLFQRIVVERFGLEPDLSMEAVQERLRGLEETLRRRILTETKIKEGAENMRRATNDKKSLAHVRTIVNEANSTLHSLTQELNDVRTYLLMTNDNTTGTLTCSPLTCIGF